MRNNSLDKSDEERIKCLKNKLQRVQAKLCESRNTCAALKQEINKAQKVLLVFLLLCKLNVRKIVGFCRKNQVHVLITFEKEIRDMRKENSHSSEIIM